MKNRQEQDKSNKGQDRDISDTIIPPRHPDLAIDPIETLLKFCTFSLIFQGVG